MHAHLTRRLLKWRSERTRIFGVRWLFCVWLPLLLRCCWCCSFCHTSLMLDGGDGDGSSQSQKQQQQKQQWQQTLLCKSFQFKRTLIAGTLSARYVWRAGIVHTVPSHHHRAYIPKFIAAEQCECEDRGPKETDTRVCARARKSESEKKEDGRNETYNNNAHTTNTTASHILYGPITAILNFIHRLT